jgi:hypothetical protein
MDSTVLAPSEPQKHPRWAFLRDVLVFQFKLLLGNIRDFALGPVALGAALIDLVIKGKREGTRFYKVLEWSAHSERVINVYSPLERQGIPEPRLNEKYTVDALISKLEGVIVREYEKGGTAAGIKLAMDRAIDQLQTKAGDRAKAAVSTVADKLRTKVDPLPPDET